MPTDPLGLVEQTLLGRYYVEAPLAQGGMGVVYRGRDLRLRRPVCIKIFHRMSGSDLVRRASYDHFVQEAFALSRLSHPNTLRIYDFGHLMDESMAPFQVSELLDGGTLGQWIRHEGPRTPEETLGMIIPVAGALSEAHAHDIIHRDVKPSNIILGLLGSRRVAKLGDFGIAKTAAPELKPSRMRAEAELETVAMRLYSVGWGAPEQLRGEAVAPTTDVFALGLVTAFMLGGQSVFSTKSDAAGIREREHSDVHVARRLRDLRILPELAEVVEIACRAAPEQRYASMDQFATALSDTINGLTRQHATCRPASRPPFEPEEAKSGVTSSLLLPADDLSAPSPLLIPVDDAPGALTASHLHPAAARARSRKTQREHEAKLVVDCGRNQELAVFGRRLTLLGTHVGGALDLGGEAAALPSQARFRVTLLPSHSSLARVNVKGLNCFVAKAARRPAAAVNVDEDMELELLAADRLRLDRVRCWFGRPADGEHLYPLGWLTLAITGAPAGAVLLDLGPGRELVLIHCCSQPALRLGGSP